MESCFPPLASLSLRGNSNGNKSQKKRHSTGGATQHHQQQAMSGVPNKDSLTKLDVLEDLDLYYIRQIASSLKVNVQSYLLC